MRCQGPSQSGVILHSGAIGDCLLTLPLAAFLKSHFGLHWLEFIGPAEYIEFYPGRTPINAVLSMEGLDLHHLYEAGRFEPADNDRLTGLFARYEYIVSFIGAGHPAFERNLLFTVHSTHSAEVVLIPAKPPTGNPLHVADYYLDVLRRDQQIEPACLPETPLITPLSEDYLAGADLLEQAGIDDEQTVVLIQPGSGAREKCWHWENFFQTAVTLQAAGMQPVFLLGPAEQQRFAKQALEAVHHFPVLENLSLTQVLQVLTQADAFCGNDSGIGHLAAGMNKKTLALFGPASTPQYAPRGQNVTVEHLPADGFARPDPHGQDRVARILLDRL